MPQKELLDILVCPYDRTKVICTDNDLRCPKCGKIFPIKDGIPIFA